MEPFETEISTRLKQIDDKDFKIKIKNSFMGRVEFKDEINELKEKEEFNKFLNDWRYISKIIFNTKLWKSHESDFFNLDNSYFLLHTEEDLNVFKQFLNKECQKNIQQKKNEYSDSDIINIYEEYLFSFNPTSAKEKIFDALKDVLTNNIKASYENITFLTKKVKINVDKPEWYSQLGLSDDQVSVIYNKDLFCKEFPDYKDMIKALAVNKFKPIAFMHLSKDNKRKILKEISENPKMTRKDIKNKVDSYRVFDENDISLIFTRLQSSWINLNSTTKKEISFQLHKIKEKLNDK